MWYSEGMNNFPVVPIINVRGESIESLQGKRVRFEDRGAERFGAVGIDRGHTLLWVTLDNGREMQVPRHYLTSC